MILVSGTPRPPSGSSTRLRLDADLWPRCRSRVGSGTTSPRDPAAPWSGAISLCFECFMGPETCPHSSDPRAMFQGDSADSWLVGNKAADAIEDDSPPA